MNHLRGSTQAPNTLLCHHTDLGPKATLGAYWGPHTTSSVFPIILV